jgi:hypothetical protein
LLVDVVGRQVSYLGIDGGGSMSIKQTVAGARDSVRRHMSEAQMDRTAKENGELRAENRVLREELAGNRSEREQVLDLLGKAQISPSEPPERRFKLLRLVAVGGAVYAIITKTGAGNKVKEWMSALKRETAEFGSDVESRGSEAQREVGKTIEHAGRSLQQVGDSIEQSARTPKK